MVLAYFLLKLRNKLEIIPKKGLSFTRWHFYEIVLAFLFSAGKESLQIGYKWPTDDKSPPSYFFVFGSLGFIFNKNSHFKYVYLYLILK